MLRIASIACEPLRYDTLKLTVDSLYNQVDFIYIYLNEFVGYPDWVHEHKDGKVICYEAISDYWNLTDNGKFYPLHEIKEPCYYFGCDSDIQYPTNYIQHTIGLIKKHKTIITYHGRILNDPINSYYKGHKVFDFRGQQDKDYFVDVCGTGVCGFDTRYFNPTEIYKSDYKRMSDLVFSLEAKRQGKKIICASRSQNWIKQQEVPNGIMSSFTNTKQEQQIELAKLILEA